MSYEDKFMAGIISKSNIEKRLTVDKLKQIGEIRVYDKEGGVKIYSGSKLKKFALKNLGGKTVTKMREKLLNEYKVKEYQEEKRKKLIDFIEAKKKKEGLTQKEKERKVRAGRESASQVDAQGMQKPTDRTSRFVTGHRYTEREKILGEIGAEIKDTATREFGIKGSPVISINNITKGTGTKGSGKILPANPANINKLGGQPPIIKLAA